MIDILEEKAKEVFPVLIVDGVDINNDLRKGFMEGYKAKEYELNNEGKLTRQQVYDKLVEIWECFFDLNDLIGDMEDEWGLITTV